MCVYEKSRRKIESRERRAKIKGKIEKENKKLESVREEESISHRVERGEC